MSKNKTTFVFNVEWYNILKDYPAEVRLEVYDAMMRYVATGILAELKPMARMAFSFIKKEIDANIDKYNETCRKRSEAGKKHNGNQYGTNGTNVPKMEQMEQMFQNGTDNDNEYDNDKKETISKDIVKKKNATNVATLTQKRKDEFYQSLIPFLEKYEKEMVRDFFEYWSEPNQAKTKMRFEMEKTWDTERRLATWARRDNNFKQQRNGKTFKSFKQVDREYREEQHNEFAKEIISNLVS